MEINKLGPYEKVIDLHSSVRSRLISLLFSIRGIGVFRIVKGRKENSDKFVRRKKFLLHFLIQ
ncbi:hypothetical protein LEP1GSC170_1062 [Leptospira interrogans serovar Bataviae str. HAI135]|nr:hypothetical protein LEP1GSC170_1062 [Leptospira interrogans serovar Bataviae str. HAI135]